MQKFETAERGPGHLYLSCYIRSPVAGLHVVLRHALWQEGSESWGQTEGPCIRTREKRKGKKKERKVLRACLNSQTGSAWLQREPVVGARKTLTE